MKEPEERRTVRMRSYEPILKASHKKFRPYVLAAGQALLQWNILYEEMGSVFLSIMFEGYSVQKVAVWSSVTSDRGKRDMLLAATATRRPWPTEMPREEINRRAVIAARIRDLCGLANDLEISRNNIAHGPILFSGGAIAPDILLLNLRARALVNKDLLREFRYVRDFAVVLGEFAKAIDRAIHSPRASMPRKPERPSRDGRK